MGDISEPIQKCILILKSAKTDTEKFAALFMVTKLVKSKDCNSTAKKALFEAIGFKFLKKLLTGTNVQDDCPPSVYKSVALSILTNFCNEPELSSHPEMLANIPVFLDIVQTSDNEDYDDNLIIISEAYTCLQCIAEHEAGQKALIEVGAITKMSEIYSHQSFQTDEALNILVKLVSRYGPAAWGNDPKPFHSLVNKIALDFATDQSERKFELATILSALLYSCNKSTVVPGFADETWHLSIYKALYDILTSKIGKNQRDPALKLAANIIDLLGVEWTFNDEENPKKFFLLLLQLCAIEVRMQLEDRSFKQAFANAELVTACFIVLESSINYMGTDQLDLEQKEKQSVYTSLKGAFNAVVSILTKVSNDKNKDKLPDAEKVFICAMVRVLVAWIAQETTAMREQIYALLPYIFTLANDSFHAHRSRKMAEKTKTEGEPMDMDISLLGQIDLLRLMLPALCHLVVEDKARDIVLNLKEEDILYEAMNFHWSIVHYKKPPIPKSERGKARTQPEPELDPKVLEDMKDSRAAMVSLCNIFMNLTVLAPKVVENSMLFNTLLKFIFNNLPELKNIPDNLVLHGHLAVLGLLLLKQQASKVKKNDFSICRYIQSTIRFLWDAYNVDESNDPNELVVSMTYKEHWNEIADLWFLGMQTLSGVLQTIPWISEFAIESGWAQGIAEMLVKVKVGTLPPNVKSAFEDFLCRLVDSNEGAIPVLKKGGALKMCRNHRLMDLGKKLFGD
ncbi:neurochondrin homolog [Danaus plexippus]|uniref:Neurochondrin protein n=1 Tax=Danaus plexippus plexippus TaxID=278856 RepID=A0A212FJ80_DANPL|nr:neurochondrin homolog [Danaus plexippus]OWR53798.1 Neurochondrin protein [Danaus plexippus plexippus]